MIEAVNLGKCYKVYNNPQDRLKQLLRRNHQYYEEHWALRNVSFCVERGSPVALIGKNGSGKSTLLQLVSGTLAASEGSVSCKGRIGALLELGSGFDPEFSGIENIKINAALLGLSQQDLQERLEDILVFADIGSAVHQPVKTYSSGMVVRLAFAVMANVKPEILIIDEALSVGDAIFNQKCARFIKNYSDNHCLLFVSHDMNTVASLCSHAIWLERGAMVGKGPSKNVIKNYTRACYEETMHANAKISTQEASINKHSANSDDQETSQQETDLQATLANCWIENKDYGNRHGLLYKIEMFNQNGEFDCAPRAGDNVRLTLSSFAQQDIDSLMAGYIVKDGKGQIIWGQNSRSLGVQPVKAGEHIQFEFMFCLPPLPGSEYVISAAISEGSPEQPIVIHYKEDAMVIRPISDRNSIFGLVGVNHDEVYLSRRIIT